MSDTTDPSGESDACPNKIYDPVAKTDRKVQLLIECSDKVIKHLPNEILANIAAGLPEKAFTVTVELLEVGERPTGRKRKR